jgi:hypothetical protein
MLRLEIIIVGVGKYRKWVGKKTGGVKPVKGGRE